MDINETLRILRLLSKQIEVDDNEAIKAAHAEEMAEHFDALDNWLSSEGFLPDSWKRTHYRDFP